MKFLKISFLMLLLVLVVEAQAKSKPMDSQVTPIVRVAPAFPFKEKSQDRHGIFRSKNVNNKPKRTRISVSDFFGT